MSRQADTRKVFVPFVQGIATRNHPYALEAPALESCVDASFAAPGAIGKRRAYSALSTDTQAGGTITNIRRIVGHGSELLAFTDTELYVWSPALSVWVSKGDHLAIKTSERTRFVRTTEQIDCDRAELNGVVMYAWTDSGNQVYLAAMDKTSGAVLLDPTAQFASSSRPRLVALTNRIMLTYQVATTLRIKDIDVSDLLTDGPAAPNTFLSTASGEYDVVAFSATQVAVAARTTGNLYNVYIIGEDRVTDDSVTGPGSRACDGPIALAVESNSSSLAVIRSVASGTAIKGDILDSALDDTAHIDKAVGTYTTANSQITAAFRSVQDSSEYRCYAFWSGQEVGTASQAWESQSNYLDTGGNMGTAATFVIRMGIASRAFDHDGTVYFWGSFAPEGSALLPQLQNTYFLYDDAGVLHAKAAGTVAGGFAQSSGHLPQVESVGTDQYAWCGVERRIIPIGGEQKGYAARSPRDICFEFDSNEARRTVKQGETIYISGGQILQYAGEGSLYEVGFHAVPHYMAPVDGAAGAPLAGDYTYSATIRHENGRGDVDRSTSITYKTRTVADLKKVDVDSNNVHTTRRTDANNPASIEIWRTLVDPAYDAPRYLATSRDPTATGDNRFIANDPATGNITTFVDNYADSTLDDKETNPENAGNLESIAPPPATVVVAGEDRIYLAGIADNPLQVWYSKRRGEGDVAGFHEALRVTMPASGGDVVGLGILHETLVVLKETALFALDGRGIENNATGDNFGVRLVANDIGAQSHDAIAIIPPGLFFKSRKGWYVLPSTGQVPRYVGAAVADYDGDTFVCVHVLPDEHLILCVSTSRILAFDYLANGGDGAWSVWDESSLVSATVWNNVHHVAFSSQVRSQDSDKLTTGYRTSVKTAPIRLDGIAGYGCVKELHIVGRYKGTHTLGVYVYRDYQATAISKHDWTPSPTTVDDPIQVSISMPVQKMEAIAIEVVDGSVEEESGGPLGDSFELIGIELLIEPRGGLMRLPAVQKATTFVE